MMKDHRFSGNCIYCPVRFEHWAKTFLKRSLRCCAITGIIHSLDPLNSSIRQRLAQNPLEKVFAEAW